MRFGKLLLIVAVCVSLFSGVTVAAPSPDVNDACQGQSDTVVVFIANTDVSSTDEIRVYPSTTVYLVYCNNGQALDTERGGSQLWGISDDIGLKHIESNGDYYRAEIPENKTKLILDETTVTGREPTNTLKLKIQQGPTVYSNLTDSRLTLLSGNDDYKTFEGIYYDAQANVSEAAAKIGTIAENIKKGGREDFIKQYQPEAEAALQELKTSQKKMRSSAAELEAILFNNSANPVLPPDRYAGVLESLHRSQTEIKQTTQSSLKQYRDALDSLAASAKSTILFNVLLGLLIGLLIAGAISGYRVHAHGRKVKDFSDFGGEDFDRSLLRRPLVVAAAFLFVGFIALLVTGIGGALI